MESAFGVDFGSVRVHTGAQANMLNHQLSARAFTTGQDIFFRQGEYNPGSSGGQELLAHELTHVVQQNGDIQAKLVVGAPDDAYEEEADRVARAVVQCKLADEEEDKEVIQTKPDHGQIQRRLVAFGTLPDVNALLGLIAPAAGLTLNLNVANNQVQIAAISPAAPPSPALRTQFTNIINHATQHAEVIIARGQPGVQVGAFPQPSDLTVTRVQQIDIDDILAIEKGAPGNGVAKAAHEINENFQAHAAIPAAGVDLFPNAHQAGVAAESAVTAELVGPGRRVADVTVAVGPNRQRVIQDFENYYLVYRTLTKAATQNVTVTSAARRPKVTISTRTIDNFGASGLFIALGAGAAIPGAGAAIITAAAADVAANPTATVHIEGFSDNSEFLGGIAASQRATAVNNALQAAGVAAGRIHAEGRGATNFVAPNTTPANLALNRRVVITVTRPGP
jgi:outer membrane protein OmpA-like peptidoglycan-associated protein